MEGGGVVDAACRGARNAGGITIGILPTEKVSDANEWCSIVIPTGMGHARNVLTVPWQRFYYCPWWCRRDIVRDLHCLDT
ncbi:MAG: hypothetical protein Q7J76_03915 [Candidatus Brocadiaceae bacterium]|uniref:SLOG cluster 4 domain-containing protein n=1 Tax=Candidatus Wunengus sp. YC61 TaxID=3367698 RepID=UPI0027245B1F|nr:hypothetical protein [Candidatus Brocadiaceae bacterium]